MQGQKVEELMQIMKKVSHFYLKKRVNMQGEIRQKCKNNKAYLEAGEMYKKIKCLCCNYAVVDWMDEDSCCNELKILLHEKQEILDDDIELIGILGGEREDLRIFFSVLEKYYYMFLEKTKYNPVEKKWDFYIIQNYSKEQEKLVKRIEDYLYMMKWMKITDMVARSKIPDIETELKELGQVTVFDCLFTEKVDIEDI